LQVLPEEVSIEFAKRGQTSIILADPDQMRSYKSTIVTLEDEGGKKYIHDGWIKFVSDRNLCVGDKVFCSVEFYCDGLFLELF
jgi:hypothetical protein